MNILHSMAVSKNSELLLVLFSRGTYKHSYCIYCAHFSFKKPDLLEHTETQCLSSERDLLARVTVLLSPCPLHWSLTTSETYLYHPQRFGSTCTMDPLGQNAFFITELTKMHYGTDHLTGKWIHSWRVKCQCYPPISCK